MRAYLALRDGLHYRRAAFAAGLEALGYTVIHGLPDKPRRADLLVTWNRYRENARMADRFEEAGLPVLVAENGYLGNDFAGGRWFALARNQHNGAGTWPYCGPDRWDALQVPLAPFRSAGGEVVILPQRGIGPVGVAMPLSWPGRVKNQLQAQGVAVRIRPHPGIGKAIPLERDLANASRAVTWGSGAAIKALTWGIPVESHMPGWIGAQDNTDAGRLAMFRRLAWAMWRLDEISTGEAFRCLLPRN